MPSTATAEAANGAPSPFVTNSNGGPATDAQGNRGDASVVQEEVGIPTGPVEEDVVRVVPQNGVTPHYVVRAFSLVVRRRLQDDPTGAGEGVPKGTGVIDNPVMHDVEAADPLEPHARVDGWSEKLVIVVNSIVLDGPIFHHPRKTFLEIDPHGIGVDVVASNTSYGSIVNGDPRSIVVDVITVKQRVGVWEVKVRILNIASAPIVAEPEALIVSRNDVIDVLDER